MSSAVLRSDIEVSGEQTVGRKIAVKEATEANGRRECLLSSFKGTEIVRELFVDTIGRQWLAKFLRMPLLSTTLRFLSTIRLLDKGIYDMA